MKTEEKAQQGQRRKKCISCRSELNPDVVIIGDQYPSAIYPKTENQYTQLIQRSSLNVTQCKNPECSLVQLSHEYDLSSVFQYYPYVSGSTATMRNILKDLSQEVENRIDLTENDIVLDIGGNDGTLLSCLSKKVKGRVNIDAAHGIDSVVKDADYLRVETQFNAKSYQELNLPAPKIIFSVAMFYHLDDPVGFCKQVREVMSPDTTWCIQMTYLGSMLENNIYDNIVHEHVAYYSLASLNHVLKLSGLRAYHAKIVNSYGGSIRVYVTVNDSPNLPAMTSEYLALQEKEKASELNLLGNLKSFNERIQLLKVITRNWIDHLVEKNGPMLALGASTKGNMICQFLGLSKEHISAVLDNNEKKIGSVLVGSGIPIIDEKEHLNKLSEYMIVLPYYYSDFFKRLICRNLPTGKKHYLVEPLPIPRVITLTNENKS